MTGPSRSEGSGVRMPRMRPCAVEMTGTVCCADEDPGENTREKQRERRWNKSKDGQDRRPGRGEAVLLVLGSDMIAYLGVAGR